jgi:O-antigen/teichoic acid export membrane protein
VNYKIQAFKNVSSNWFGVAITLIVGFFLSPFILHRLGDEGFGLWILIFSLTGYYGILDFGISSSIVKYVSECESTGDRERLLRIVNVSVFVYTCVAFALSIFVYISSRYIEFIFRIPPNLQHTARLLFLMVGLTVALGFPLSVFEGILQGLQKFYFVNLTQSVVTVIRGILILLALSHGMGLLAVAFITVVLPLFSYAAFAWKVLHTIPLQFGRRFVDRATFRQVFNYSFFSFISVLAFRLRFQTDAVIIGVMLSSAAITHFSIGSKLVSYSFLLVGGLVQIVTPMSSHFDAIGDRGRLKKLFIMGNGICALTVFPISIILIVLGRSVIDVWVGPQYQSSYVILVILLIPSVLSGIQGSSRQILYGMGRHQVLALVNVSEAAVNLTLSIILIRYWGIVGDAIGTAIPLALTSIFFLPVYVCRMLQVPLKDFLSKAYLPPLVLCAPLAVTLLFLQRLFHPHNYLQLAAQVAAGGVVYGLCVVWLFLVLEPMGLEVRLKFRLYLLQAFGR